MAHGILRWEVKVNSRCINLRPKKTQRRMAQRPGASPRLLVRQRGGADGYPAVGLRSSHKLLCSYSSQYWSYCILPGLSAFVYKQFCAHSMSFSYCHH